MPRKKAKATVDICKPHKTKFVIGGIISIILGICLWFGCLQLEKTIAIILVLAGLAKLSFSCCH